MENQRICPFAKDECLEEKCGLFCEYTDSYCFVSIAQSMEDILSQIKRDNNNDEA
jgi:hypothetical protein